MKKLLLLLPLIACACATINPGYMPDGIAFRPGCDATVVQSDETAIRLGCVEGPAARPCTTTVTAYGFGDPRRLTVTNCF